MVGNKGRLAGKRILVTGAAQGIGRASALAMAREGAEVWATDANERALESLGGMDGVTIAPLDVTNGAQAEKLAQSLPPLTGLFNCAGFVHQGSILDCSEDDWDKTQTINVKGMFLVTKAFLPGMLSTGNASIVNMSSMASHVKGVPNRFAYSASKAAIIGLTKSIAADFIKSGLRCNAVCPGIIDTPSLSDRLAAMGDLEKAKQDFTARQPTGRLGAAEEVAPLIIYLISDEASFVTGCAYSIDGGISL